MAAYTTIDDPSAYFKVQLYTGTGSSLAVTFNDTDTDMQPDLLWIKGRDAAESHSIFDSVRGVQKGIYANNDNDQDTFDGVTAIGSDGFTVGNDGKTGSSGYSPNGYVAYCWKESADAGFDIIDYDGSGSNTTISHNLSAVPKTIWIKEYSNNTNWAIYHHTQGNTNFLKFNSAAANEDTDNWQDTTPTSSVFSLGSGGQTNTSGRDYIAYVFAEKQGFSKFGKYTGNVNADGAFIYLGFSPAFFMFAETGNAEGFIIYDNRRSDSGGGNPNDQYFVVSSAAAAASGVIVDFVSNGVKLRANNGHMNEGSYCYMAFAESPLVNSEGVPCTAR